LKLSQARRFYKKTHHLRGLLRENPVLVMGLAIPLVVVVSSSFKNALGMSIAMACSIIPTMLIASLWTKKLTYWVRIAVNCLISMSLLMVSVAIIRFSAPTILDSLGIYMGLTGINTIMIHRTEAFAIKSKPLDSLLDGVVNTLGYSLVICVIAAIREIFGNGTFMLNPVELPFKLDGLLIPFSGLIFLGFLSAFAKWLNRAVLASVCKRSSKSKRR